MRFYKVTRTLVAYVKASTVQAAIDEAVQLGIDLPDNYDTETCVMARQEVDALKAAGIIFEEE